MLANYFQLTSLPAGEFFGKYDPNLVASSFIVAVFASYIALDLTSRLRDTNNSRKSWLLWLIGGAIAMGCGIWTMHFIGMLSFSIPGLSIKYDRFWTVISLLVAIVASGFALLILGFSRNVRVEYYIACGIVLGLAIASMHYTGMEGMLVTLDIRYLPGLFLLSILVAILASEAALWMAIKSNKVIARLRQRIKFASAIIMGIAICGMHYTGMAASIFSPLCATTRQTGIDSNPIDPSFLALSVMLITLLILGVALLASNYKEALNQEQLEKARQLGMAEIAASTLHNVGNVLNSVTVSTNQLEEMATSTRMAELEKLNNLLQKNKTNLPAFFSEQSGDTVVEFVDELSKYWKNEKERTVSELKRLNKQVRMIKDIISTQQEISKTYSLEKNISVNELLNESLLILGLKDNKLIQVIRQYGKNESTIIDKVKLLQVMVNIFENAKDAVMANKSEDKKIIIHTFCQNNTIVIEVIDNGVGIEAKNLDRIFNYGFTTKNTGHGFGLHSTALTVHSMGGDIAVKSEGLNKGAIFTITFPRKME